MTWALVWILHGLTLSLAVRAALWLLPGVSAAGRYIIWWVTLAVILVLPLMRPAVTVRVHDVQSQQAAGQQAPALPAASQAARSHATAPTVDATGGASTLAITAAAAATSGAWSLAGYLPFTSQLPNSAPWPMLPKWMGAALIGVWLGCVMLGLLRLTLGIGRMQHLKRGCAPLGLARERSLPVWSVTRAAARRVRVCVSPQVRTAAMLGLVRPIIVVPRDVASELSNSELEQVILHEHAHVRRWDDWTRLAQVVVTTFCGWHPAVRMASRALDFEREAACDDWVVRQTGTPRAYANCLAKMAEITLGLPADAAPQLGWSSGHTTTRIERLLDRKTAAAGSVSMWPALVSATAVVCAAFVSAQALPVVTTQLVAAESVGLTARADAPLPVEPAAEQPRGVLASLKPMLSRFGPSMVVEAAGPPAPNANAERASDDDVRSLNGSTPSPATIDIQLQPASRVVPSATPVDARMLEPITPRHTTHASALTPAPTDVSTGVAAPAASAPERTERGEAVASAEPLVPALKGASVDEDGVDEDGVDEDGGPVRDALQAAGQASGFAIGVAARHTGRSVKKAGAVSASASSTAVTKAASSVKDSSAKAFRFVGRLKKLLP